MLMGQSRVLLFICIFYMGYMKPVIIQVDTIKTANDKIITFLHDKHNQSPEEQGQLRGILNFLQQNKEPQSSFHILIEQVSSLGTLPSSEYAILSRMSECIQQAMPSFTHVTVEDMEVRHIANAAYGILTSEMPEVYDSYFMHPIKIDVDKTIGTINFQDILDEFDQLEQLLSGYYLNHMNKVVSGIYTSSMRQASESYNQFKRNLAHVPSRDITILNYAKAQCDQDTSRNSKILAENILYSFRKFLDLRILQNILTTTSKNIIVVAGYNHVQNIINMLYNLEVSSMYHAINNIHEQPVAINQIVQGLSNQLKLPTTTYTATLTYVVTTVILLYCLLEYHVTLCKMLI